MNSYTKFKKSNLDTTCIGLIQSSDNTPYFCTPKGSTIIGWEGVDGVHYCMIPGFDDMVFCVTPMDGAANYVYPIAASFQDFLSLLLACGTTSVLAQISSMLNVDTYISLTSMEPTTSEQQLLLNELAHHFSLSPMSHPYDYVKALQKDFDYASIPFSKEYYETSNEELSLPLEWNVYYGDGFWGHSSRQRPGTAIEINKRFTWDSDVIYVPALYSCGKGLVIDFCIQVAPKDIEEFLSKWETTMESFDLSQELQEQIETEHPLNRNIDFSLSLNGKSISSDQSYSMCWNPCVEEGIENPPEAKQICDHYQCDPSYGWIFLRVDFPWATKRKVPLRSLSISLNENPRYFAGPHFSFTDGTVTFIHPVTNIAHTLTIQSCSSEQLPDHAFENDRYDYPSHFQQLTYCLEPDIEPSACVVSDTCQGDSPREHSVDNDCITPSCFCGVSLIGGGDGPTSLFLCNGFPNEKTLHTACSSLYFEAVDGVEWRVSFYEVVRKGVSFELLS